MNKITRSDQHTPKPRHKKWFKPKRTKPSPPNQHTNQHTNHKSISKLPPFELQYNSKRSITTILIQRNHNNDKRKNNNKIKRCIQNTPMVTTPTSPTTTKLNTTPTRQFTHNTHPRNTDTTTTTTTTTTTLKSQAKILNQIPSLDFFTIKNHNITPIINHSQSHNFTQKRQFASGPNIDPNADPFPHYGGDLLKPKPPKPLPFYSPPPSNLNIPESTENEYTDSDPYGSMSSEGDIPYDPDDPNSYRLVIPNRYSIEDFLLAKSKRIRQRIELDIKEDIANRDKIFDGEDDESVKRPKGPMERLRRWQSKRQRDKLHEDGDDDIRGIDSDLELYGGINLDTYNAVVLEPSEQFTAKVMEARRIDDDYLNDNNYNNVNTNTKNNNNNNNHNNNNNTSPSQSVSSKIPVPLPGVSIADNGSYNNQVSKGIGSMWSKMISNYSPQNVIENKTSAKNYTPSGTTRAAEGANYLKERLSRRFPEVSDTIQIKNATDNDQPQTPFDKRQRYNNVTHHHVLTNQHNPNDNKYTQLALPPSKQTAKGYEFCPRDAYEAQLFILDRMKTDQKLRQTLRDTFKFYTKELDPITGLDACKHLLSIELYLYLKTLEDTGVKLGFAENGGDDLDPLKQQKKGMWARFKSLKPQKDELMSTASVLLMSQQYRTKYLQMVLNDDSGELLQLLEEEYVQLLHLVAELNEEVVRNAYIDTTTAYELLHELYRGVSSEQYMLDFEDQLNCILIQFAKQRREKWDGHAYNAWKDNRITQLRSGLLHYQSLPMNRENLFQVEQIEKQIRQIELLGDDADNAEQMNNDVIIDQIIAELDMPKLKLYINNALLYYYRTHLYQQYGFENDIGALLMTKALYSIPDMNIVYYMDDITESANRCRDFAFDNRPLNGDDNDGYEGNPLGENEYDLDDDENAEIEDHDNALRREQDRLSKEQFKQQVMREKLDPNYNENFPAGWGDWFRRKQQDESVTNEQKNFQKTKGDGKRQKSKFKLFGNNDIDDDTSYKSQYLEPLPQYSGQYDRYGLPVVRQPSKSALQYSDVVSKYHYHDKKKHDLIIQKQLEVEDDSWLPHTGVPFQPDYLAEKKARMGSGGKNDNFMGNGRKH